MLIDVTTSWAVLIGTAEHTRESDLEALPAVRNNLGDLAAALADPAVLGMPSDHIRILADPFDPSKVGEAIRDAGSRAAGTLLVYYAGHGLPDENGQLFLALSGTRTQDLPYDALPFHWIARDIRRSTAGTRILILDCCYAGLGESNTMSGRDPLAEQSTVTGTWTLFSSAYDTPSLSPKGKRNTAFTGALIDLLNSGVPDGPNELDGDTVLQALRRRLEPDGFPRPDQRNSDMGYRIAIAKNRAMTTHEHLREAAVDSGIAEQNITEASTTHRWAICCSGGGIRSAAYCLGALQGLDAGGLLPKVKWILGVSGGSYIAASRALVAHDLPSGAEPHAYARGTPEERKLRSKTRDLAPDAKTVLVGLLSLVFGAIVTLTLLLAPLYALAHAWGWLLRWQGVLVPSGPHVLTAAVTGLGWWLPPVVAAGITLALFAYWQLTLGPAVYHRVGPAPWWASMIEGDHDHGANQAQLVSRAAALTGGLALAMLVTPLLISWLTRSTGWLGTTAHFAGFGARGSWSLTVLVGLTAAVAATARYCQAGFAKWIASEAAVKGKSVAAPGLFKQLASRLRQQLLPWLGSAVIVSGAVVLALLWTSYGARAGFSASQLAPVVVALAVMLLTRVAANVNSLSMNDFYWWRLANAFAVTRRAAEERNPQQARRLLAQAAATRLSQLRAGPVTAAGPDLVICGTANINAAREVPRGQGGSCLTLDPERVTLHREQGLATVEPAQALTSDYEALLGERRTTLFNMSAISGAAISPLTGAVTRQAYRILLTATNVRLGVWLPHPALVRKARQMLGKPAESFPDRWWARRPLLLLLWYLSPHLLWDRHPNMNFDREARLWAHVLKLRLRRGLAGALWYRAMQPTLGLLWAEATGHLSYRSIWMYVTDGGQYDNLGLVEALRRGASHIVVLDASGDKADTWSTLDNAIALASDDAGVDIELDPTKMLQGGGDLAPGQVARPWTYGTFTRREEVHGLPQQGEIWVCKLGWWTGAPRNVVTYAKHHRTFPGDSTLAELHDAAEFEAYQQLGAATVLDAAEHCTPPLSWTPQRGPRQQRRSPLE